MNINVKKYFNLTEIQFLSISAITLLCLTLVLGTSAFYGFPISLGDKEGFYPVIHNFSVLNDFSHPFLCYTCEERLGNPLQVKFTNHGFLFPKVQAFFLFFDDYERIETSSTIIFFLNGVLFLFLIRVNNLRTFVVFIIAISIFLYQIGRPELIISSVLIIDWYVTKNKYFNYPIFFSSLFSSILFCISPVALILYFPYIMIKNNYHDIKCNYYMNYLYFLTTPILVYVIFYIFVTQFSFIDWIQGILGASNHYNPASVISGNFNKYMIYLNILYLF